MNTHTLPKARVHFIENDRRNRMLFETETTEVYESGYWYHFGDENAMRLIGGAIFFHDSQSALSKSGGIILGFRKPASDEKQGTLVFIYEVPKSVTDSKIFSVVAAEPGRWYTGGGNWKITGV